MVFRLVALLLSVVMMTGAASAAPDHHAADAAMIDNAPDSLDLDPAILVVPVALPTPSAQLIAPSFATPQPPTGRVHAVLVFRPPR